MTPSPPKPWETSTGGVCPVAGVASAVNPHVAEEAAPPELPARPATMNPNTPLNAYSNSSLYNRGTYGASVGGYSSYASPYSRFGGGAMGGYGSYGGFGGGYGGYGQPFGGQYGGYGGMPMGPESLSQRMEAGTAATFQLLESIVGAFGGFAQMLESTYMATHSSFFAMIGVAEQFGSLRGYLGQVLSIFTLIRWVKSLINRLLGRPDPIDVEGFKSFQSTAAPAQQPAAPKPSRKPLIIFFLTVVGLPYLMTKLVRLISAKEEALRAQQQALPGATEIIDPSSLLFVRATHPFASAEPQELSFKADDIIAVLTPEHERPSAGWWRGRTRDGRIGWFPSNYVAQLPMNKAMAPKQDLPAQPQPIAAI